MVMFTSALAAAVLMGAVVAHPGHDVRHEAKERRDFVQSKPRTLASCAEKLKARGHTDKGIQRRSAIAHDIRAKRGIVQRDTASVLNTSHHSNLTGLTSDADENVLFADESSCVLQPDVTEGPYYVAGELIRSNVTEGQGGVDAYVYIQVVDTSTCDPISNIYVDLWHCNATGVYGGVSANGNGNTNDTTNLNNTAFRGIQSTDADGVTQFLTVVPGHYIGRTNHIHVLTHSPNDTTVYPNGTLGTNELLATHVGQLFFDQDLLSTVEATAPYSTNTQTVTTNAEDGILASEADTEDPMMEYVLLGDDITDGILAWATIGIDTTNSVDVQDAAYYGEGGGVALNNSGFGGGPPPSGSGTAPVASSTAAAAAAKRWF